MSRSTDDPRIVEVLTVFRRHAGHSPEQTEQYVAAIMTDGYCHDGVLCDWPMESLRALLTTFLQLAPDDDLSACVAVARAQLAALLDSENTAAMERDGDCFISGFDYPKRLEHEMEIVRSEIAAVSP